MLLVLFFLVLFFFNDPATTEIYTLSLHDALPISSAFSVWPCRYLLSVSLTAVFPVPKTFHVAADRYVMSFHARLSCAGKTMFRLGTSRPGPITCSGKLVLNESNRSPPLNVHRSSVHRSWANKPKSLSSLACSVYGVARTVIWFGTPLLNRYVRGWKS